MGRFARAIATIVAAAAVALAAAAGQARELRAADTHPEDYPTVQALNFMGRLLRERTQGRWSIKVFHSRQLGEERETIDQARAGAIDLVRVNLAPFNALVPETIVPSLPFLFRDGGHLHRVLDGSVGEDILRAFERHGLVGLAFYDSGARSFYNARRPVTGPADLKGLKIRVQESPLFIALAESLGAIPVPMPYGQVEVGLRTGVIDGAENNWPSYQDAGHFAAAPHYSLTEHTMAPEVVAVSKRVWDSLSTGDQAQLRQAARDSAAHMRRLWSERERAAQAALAKAGVRVTRVDKAAFAEAARPIYDRFLAEPRLKEMVRRIQAVE